LRPLKNAAAPDQKFLAALARPLMRTGLYALRSPSPADPEGGKPVLTSGNDPSRKIV
jgi:hypothetical protein